MYIEHCVCFLHINTCTSTLHHKYSQYYAYLIPLSLVDYKDIAWDWVVKDIVCIFECNLSICFILFDVYMYISMSESQVCDNVYCSR